MKHFGDAPIAQIGDLLGWFASDDVGSLKQTTKAKQICLYVFFFVIWGIYDLCQYVIVNKEFWDLECVGYM